MRILDAYDSALAHAARLVDEGNTHAEAIALTADELTLGHGSFRVGYRTADDRLVSRQTLTAVLTRTLPLWMALADSA